MKKLFIYYSDTGNGDAVAKRFAEKGYDIRKVIPKHNLPKTFFFKVLTGGFIAGFNKKAKLKDYNSDVSDYTEIVIGSPIWNGKLSCPINTVLTKTDFTDKIVSFVLYSGGGTAPKAEKYLKSHFPKSRVIVLKEPKKYPQTITGLEI